MFNYKELQSLKVSRKRFIQLSILAFFGLFFWNPFKQATNKNNFSTLPANINPADFKKVVTMSQAEYDSVAHDKNTLYIIT